MIRGERTPWAGCCVERVLVTDDRGLAIAVRPLRDDADMSNTPRDPDASTDASTDAGADAFTDGFGQRMIDIAANIHRSGFMLIMVGSGKCSVPGRACEPSDECWSYSIGMVERGMPEVVVTGLADVHALYVANFVFDEFRAGRGMEVGEVRWLGSAPLRLDDIDDAWLATDRDRMAQWFDHYGPGRSAVQLPPVRQIVWGDAEGHFPDDPSCDPTVVARQPVLADDPLTFPTPTLTSRPTPPAGLVEGASPVLDHGVRDEIRRMFDREQHPSRNPRRRRS